MKVLFIIFVLLLSLCISKISRYITDLLEVKKDQDTKDFIKHVRICFKGAYKEYRSGKLNSLQYSYILALLTSLVSYFDYKHDNLIKDEIVFGDFAYRAVKFTDSTMCIISSDENSELKLDSLEILRFQTQAYVYLKKRLKYYMPSYMKTATNLNSFITIIEATIINRAVSIEAYGDLSSKSLYDFFEYVCSLTMDVLENKHNLERVKIIEDFYVAGYKMLNVLHEKKLIKESDYEVWNKFYTSAIYILQRNCLASDYLSTVSKEKDVMQKLASFITGCETVSHLNYIRQIVIPYQRIYKEKKKQSDWALIQLMVYEDENNVYSLSSNSELFLIKNFSKTVQNENEEEKVEKPKQTKVLLEYKDIFKEYPMFGKDLADKVITQYVS